MPHQFANAILVSLVSKTALTERQLHPAFEVCGGSL